ncbi:UDP-N-acetylmuramoyl-tripeptide--D-alanyl-D-alanine ligase [Brumimicrobium aurantiacum]|uniref:UDP-N-acetylmuramoyl-tripeptide--D-alanyl-D-alanine ligase n=1 Tax=Brumimicrobium aurantiacum TaxID=1737063 RepID=A0A3E1EWR3_9FLAO|nr:UDP-N-acetylmuramoyl-tripeptide--D-alanyl-D-alanine ligase [Brumimicrobium aurantiacum]RFC53989.1 UDP-N-acetylmuramoyl-tripeptide--D-alanyl-D-alanine ligase [Brumimicrobium aurantiacum]
MEDKFKLLEECTGVSTDTRKIEKDNLFIALKGDNFDGNKYALKAIEQGAKYAVVDDVNLKDHQNLVYVEDALVFLQQLANYHRKKFDIPVIGITGTNGKTTTKELTAAVLQQKYNIHFTQGNLNNHIGVPLTLLQLNKEHDIAIIEMGASKIGDIKELTDIAAPTHGIITNIGYAHIEGFGSPENILITKTELYRAIEEVEGHLFYNGNDEVLEKQLPQACSTSTYGVNGDYNVQGSQVELTPLLSFKWSNKEYSSPTVSTQIIGKYNFYNMLAAICIGQYFEVNQEDINNALEAYKPNNNRSQLETTDYNTVILDAYNANPTSVKSALENFSEITKENKMFVLGDMLELGENTLHFHTEIIELSKALNLQGMFVGKIFSSLKEKHDILAFEDTQAAKDFISIATPEDNLILLKGSRGIGLEKLMEVI